MLPPARAPRPSFDGNPPDKNAFHQFVPVDVKDYVRSFFGPIGKPYYGRLLGTESELWTAVWFTDGETQSRWMLAEPRGMSHGKPQSLALVPGMAKSILCAV